LVKTSIPPIESARVTFPVIRNEINIVSMVPIVRHEIDLIILLYDFSLINSVFGYKKSPSGNPEGLDI